QVLGNLGQVGVGHVGQVAVVHLAPHHQVPDDLVRLAERDAPADQVLGQVGGESEAGGGAAAQPVRVDPQRRDQPGHGGQDQEQGVDRVEDRLLVLLQVPVVRQ